MQVLKATTKRRLNDESNMDRQVDVDNDCLCSALSRRSFDMGLDAESVRLLVDRRMNREHEYEKLLNRVAGICSDNEQVDWDAADASAEFRAIRNEIAWGLYEIDKGDGDKPSPTKAEQEYEVSHEECAGILGLSVAQYIADYINRERENSNTVWRTSCASQIWNGCSVLILDALDTWMERRIT